MLDEVVIIETPKPEKRSVEIYRNFLRCRLLSQEEKLIFIALKSFLDSLKALDSEGIQGEVCPTIKTIQKMTKMGTKKVIDGIKKLCEKGIIKKIRRGPKKSNLYILSDYPEMWTCDSVEEIREIVNNKSKKTLTAEEHTAEPKNMGHEVNVKKKERVSGNDKTPDTEVSVVFCKLS